MSRTTKKKYVVEEVINTYDLPTDEQRIVKVLRSCGNNLHEVETAEGDQYLASMPNKFRKHIWIKRGDFVIIDPIEEGVRVKGEITRILLKDQIKYFKKEGVWPKGFLDSVAEQERKCSNSEDAAINTKQTIVESENTDKDSESEASDSEDDLFVNTNRPTVDFSSSSSESEEEGDK